MFFCVFLSTLKNSGRILCEKIKTLFVLPGGSFLFLRRHLVLCFEPHAVGNEVSNLFEATIFSPVE